MKEKKRQGQFLKEGIVAGKLYLKIQLGRIRPTGLSKKLKVKTRREDYCASVG